MSDGRFRLAVMALDDLRALAKLDVAKGILDDGGLVSGAGELEVGESAEHLGVGVHDDLVLEVLGFHELSVAKAPVPAEVPLMLPRALLIPATGEVQAHSPSDGIQPAFVPCQYFPRPT